MKKLREGFTTGSAATAACAAALELLLWGHKLKVVKIPLPPQNDIIPGYLDISVAEIEILTPTKAFAYIIKDGGDDPDATHKAKICATVELIKLENSTQTITICGGQGVGIVSLPGLPISLGQAAINPKPQEQIRAAVKEICAKADYSDGVKITISVPEGEQIAKHTFNERLGILGGISILGTCGIVRPYSHEAWQETIVQELNIAKALNCQSIGLCSGRRTERLLRQNFPNLAPQAFIQAADFIGFALKQAADKDFKQAELALFFGKLLKLAQNNIYTHAHTAQLNMSMLADICENYNIPASALSQISLASTASYALEIILQYDQAPDILKYLSGQAHKVLSEHLNTKNLKFNINLFHIQERLLLRYEQ